MLKKHQVVLCILDGWGERKEADHNGILQAKTPYLDEMKQVSPHSLLEASGKWVGLPEGQIGNSEVGHMHIGCGRLIFQDLPRISHLLETGELAQDPRWKDWAAKLQQTGGAFHVLGLLSPGGVHSHQEHIVGLLKILQDFKIPTWFHGFLDGRDTLPSSAKLYLENLRKAFPDVRWGTVGGRYFAMDRDQRWDRIQKAYNAMVCPDDSPQAESPEEALQKSYERGKTDEFMEPVAIKGYPGMKAGDGILMANFRSDRARQILLALLQEDFPHFQRGSLPSFPVAVGMVSYSQELDEKMDRLVDPQSLKSSLGEMVSSYGFNQVRLAETEKYAHVTFFFNGGQEEPFPGEKRILVPSPSVSTYDQSPQMAAREITHHLIEEISNQKAELIVVNYANTDMVGHTGDWEATLKAVETVDDCLGQVWDAVQKKNAILLITADHGNAEFMKDEDGHPYTAHTCFPVPFLVVNGPSWIEEVRDGTLADIAVTIFDLWDLPPPSVMTGKTLLKRKNSFL